MDELGWHAKRRALASTRQIDTINWNNMSAELESKLGYHFKQAELLQTALTHRSKGGDHNERLEFLGDAIVNCVIAEALYRQFNKATEGELSRWRSTLVNRDTLTDLAKKFDL